MSANGGHLHMDVEVVEPLLHGLSVTGDELDSAWQAGQSAISAGEAGIGGDELGQAFRSIYLDDRQLVGANAGALPAAVRLDAQAGTTSMRDYLSADQRAAAAMPTGASPALAGGGARIGGR